MKRPIRVAFCVGLVLASGCGKTVAPQAGSIGPAPTLAAAEKSGKGIVPNLSYQFLGPHALVVKYEVPESRLSGLLDPAFRPEVRNGKASVYAIVAEYHAGGVVGLPATNLKARQILYAVMCEDMGKERKERGFASFGVVEDQRVFSWLVRDVGYPSITLPLPWVRSGDRLTSMGEADFDITRKTDALTHIERSASLSRLMVGKHDHLAHEGEIVEVPFIYPVPVLDGYGVRVDHIRFGTLTRRGLVSSGEKPADIWWWEGPNVIVGKRERYPVPARAAARF